MSFSTFCKSIPNVPCDLSEIWKGKISWPHDIFHIHIKNDTNVPFLRSIEGRTISRLDTQSPSIGLSKFFPIKSSLRVSAFRFKVISFDVESVWIEQQQKISPEQKRWCLKVSTSLKHLFSFQFNSSLWERFLMMFQFKAIKL